MNFVGFPSIESFHHIVRYAAAYPDAIKAPVKYRGKVKLHGTNAGIRVVNGEVQAQSRSQLITVQADNAGFARWVDAVKDYWLVLNAKYPDCTVFGEWAGPGIMKGTAINQAVNKFFAVFAIYTPTEIITDPTEIEALLPHRPANVFVLPWYGEEFEVDYCNEASMRRTVPNLNAVVETVEKCDPWAKEALGVEGVGEGVVYYPQTRDTEVFKTLVFKAKGEQHRVVKAKEAVQMAPEVAENVSAFVNMFVTEARCEQGLAQVGGQALMPKMKDFLQWMMGDVVKESKAELEASGMKWEQVDKAVLKACREWFIQKSRTV